MSSLRNFPTLSFTTALKAHAAQTNPIICSTHRSISDEFDSVLQYCVVSRTCFYQDAGLGRNELLDARQQKEGLMKKLCCEGRLR